MMAALNISYDDYIRTTEPRHARACQALWLALEKNGDIYLDKYAGWYSVRAGSLFRRGRNHSSATTASAASRWARRSSGRRKKPISSACRPIRTNCSISMRSVPDFVLPRERLNEVASFVKSGLAGSVGFAHDV